MGDGVLVYQLREKMSKKVCAHRYIYVHINIKWKSILNEIQTIWFI